MKKTIAVVVGLYCSLVLAGNTPVKLQVSPGQQQPVTLSRLHLNRIITPFAAPQIRTIDQADIRIEGSVIYLSSQLPDPFECWERPIIRQPLLIQSRRTNQNYYACLQGAFYPAS